MDDAAAGRAFAVNPAYGLRWRRGGWICLAVSLFLVLAGAAMLTVGSLVGAWPLLVGFLGLFIGGFILRGGARAEKSVYRLEVGPEALTVVWRNQTTALPWARLQWATVTRRGAREDLEVLPEPGFRPRLPRRARPTRSRHTPEQLNVFPLGLLGDARAECLAEIGRHLTLR